MATICGAVIARDEERSIDRCLGSLRWVDALLVVVDDRTSDSTAEIAARHGARVEVHPFADFAHQRNGALRMAETDWLLFVDADEVVPEDLAQEVRSVIGKGPEAVSGYWISRRNILFGRWIRGAGWSPDYQLRLLRPGRAAYREDRTVHELVDLQGEVGYLEHPLVHYNYASLGEFVARQRSYTSMEAKDLFRQGVKVKLRNYLLQPWRQFWRRFVLLKGYQDGGLGLLLSLLLAYYEFRRYVELRSLWKHPR